jgi:uncharacterized protein YqjF (DUF2071 family)
MRDNDLLRCTEHRPWPLPQGPWIMRQTWNDLLFAHWAVTPEYLRPLVPAELKLDTFNGRCWVALTPFFMTGVTVRGVPPIPGFSQSPELNVRTYVTVNGKPGVYFFSLDIFNIVACAGARMLYGLPYFYAYMGHARRGGWIEYFCGRVDRDRADPRFHGNVAPDPALLATPAEFRARYRPTSDVFTAPPGTLEHFLAERYCLYVVDHGHILRAEIHHVPWPLQRAEAQIAANSMALADSIHLPDTPPHLLFARSLDVLVWLPYVVESEEAQKVAPDI